jgi:hypothetical protein
MRKREVETTLRAAGRVAREKEFFLIGSQAVHAYCRRPPAEVLLSQECDLYPKNHPETANLIHARLGRGSRFARNHGFYADVVTPEIAILPAGWESRLKPMRTGRVVALCLEVHDLVVSKLAAARLKDLEFIGALLRRDLVVAGVVRRRIHLFPIVRDRPRLRSRFQSVLDEVRKRSGA